MSEPVSVDCAQVDINALCEKMRVAAFDLDGTLARSKKPMHPDMAQALSTLTTLMAAIASLEHHARAMGLWEEHTWGDRIEDRGSQITFSALGQQAPVDAKEAWDPTNEKKNRLAQAVQRDVPHLLVRSGGSTSVDVSGRGIDKSYAVHELARILDVPVGSMMFVGDRLDPDGNDYPAAKAGTMAIRVAGPEETLRLCTAIIDWYGTHRPRMA